MSHSIRLLALGTLILRTIHPQPVPLDVRQDLAKSGLGLSALGGRNLRIATYFDGSSQEIHMECCAAWADLEIQWDGSIVGSNGKEMVILGPDGRKQATYPEPAYGAQISWNRQSNRLARIMELDDQGWLIQYWPLGTQHFESVATIEKDKRSSLPSRAFPQTTVSWSPDGSAIAYSVGGTIQIFTLRDGKTAPSVAGSDPSWSPDGREIAYRDQSGGAQALRLRDHASRALVPGVKIIRGIRWSPDSRFVMVAVVSPAGGFENDTSLLICRVADHKTLKVSPIVGGSTDAHSFWVVKPRKTANR